MLSSFRPFPPDLSFWPEKRQPCHGGFQGSNFQVGVAGVRRFRRVPGESHADAQPRAKLLERKPWADYQPKTPRRRSKLGHYPSGVRWLGQGQDIGRGFGRESEPLGSISGLY